MTTLRRPSSVSRKEATRFWGVSRKQLANMPSAGELTSTDVPRSSGTASCRAAGWSNRVVVFELSRPSAAKRLSAKNPSIARALAGSVVAGRFECKTRTTTARPQLGAVATPVIYALARTDAARDKLIWASPVKLKVPNRSTQAGVQLVSTRSWQPSPSNCCLGARASVWAVLETLAV